MIERDIKETVRIVDGIKLVQEKAQWRAFVKK
jgi:hypothetical protein